MMNEDTGMVSRNAGITKMKKLDLDERPGLRVGGIDTDAPAKDIRP